MNTLVILGAASLAREFYFHTIESTNQYTNYIFVNDLFEKSILVMPEIFNKEPNEKTLGVCSDYIEKYK